MNNQDDLQNDVDPKLQQLYNQLPKEQPSAELDAKILAAAKNTPAKKSRHWHAPFALAASVVMVSSVALYLHEENPAVFETSTPTTQAPAAEMAKPSIDTEANINDSTNKKPITDQLDSKITTPKEKDAPKAKQPTSADTDRIEEKKADNDSRADQIAATALANQSAKSAQSADLAREQEARQAKKEADHLTATTQGYTSYTPPAPAPIAPPPQMQPKLDSAEPTMQAARLQDSHKAHRQLSAASSESFEPAILEKSNDEAVAAAPMASAPMSVGSLAGAAMPTAKQRIKREEATDTTKSDYAKNINAPILSIEGVAMGMNREQLVAQGLMCYVDVCHFDLKQPQQETYWGMPARNAHLTAFLSRQVVTKLVLQQKDAQLNTVKTALVNVGMSSQQSCIEEKGALLISRQLGTNYFNLRSMGVGLSLAICQSAKPVDSANK